MARTRRTKRASGRNTRQTMYQRKKPRRHILSGRRLPIAAGSVAVLGILGYVYLGGSHGLIRIYRLKKERDALRHQILELQAKREIILRENRQLREDPAAIERVAREELGMVKDGEIVYRFVKPEPDSAR